MSAVRIWFNRNFATNIHTLNQIRQNADERPVVLFGSHVDATSPMLTVCDYASLEPDLVGDDYVNYALAFCAQNSIDVFLPVLAQEAIAARVDEFAAQGVRVICPPHAAVNLLADKVRTYRALLTKPELIPPWQEVTGATSFTDAVTYFADEFGLTDQLVIKPARGVGADGVRFIVPDRPNLAGLLGQVEPTVTRAEVLRILTTAQASGVPVPPLLLMPYLRRPEVSVDVLADRGSVVVAVPRVKVGRERVLDCDPAILPMVRDLVAHFELDALVNLQFRYWEGVPVLLEINTRPSGGLFQTQLADVNLPWLAVKMALGEALEPQSVTPKLGARYVTVSNQIPLTGATAVRGLGVPSGHLAANPVNHIADETGDSLQLA